METCRENISTQAAELIQSHDCIICLSVKTSPTLSAFLHSAQKKKHRVRLLLLRFTVRFRFFRCLNLTNLIVVLKT